MTSKSFFLKTSRTGEIVDGFLGFFHPCDVVGERSKFVGGFSGVETQEFCQGEAVLTVFVDTKLNVLSESFVKGLELILVLCNFLEEFKRFLDEMFPDNLHC
jgi:hypothetical protein